LGLAAHGFGRGDRLAVVGDNRPGLYAALLAAQSLGGIGVPLDPDAAPDALATVVADAGVSVIACDTFDQAALMRSAAQPVLVVVAEAAGLRRNAGRQLTTLDTLSTAGREYGEREPDHLAASIAAGVPQDVALLLYPTGDAKPATRRHALSHAQLLAAAEAIAAEDPVSPSDQALCYLPMASYEDAVYSLTLGLLGGFVCNCPAARDTVLRDLREIGPTILFAPPAACAALAQAVTSKSATAAGLKRHSLNYFLGLALRAEVLKEQGRTIPPGLAIGCWLGKFTAYAPVRDQLGLRRARWVRPDAPVAPDTARLLRALGVALRPIARPAPEPGPAAAPRGTLHA
jgi:long-chain acyl-CoA synthetase